MHRFRTAERVRVLAGMAKHAGLWVLTWACVLVVSGTVAYAGEQALERNSLDRSAPLEIAAASTASGMATATEATGARAVGGSQWVLLWSVNPETRASCLTTRDRVSADMLRVHPEDLERLAAEVCDIWLLGASGGAYVTAP
jgi:hypothetical protein